MGDVEMTEPDTFMLSKVITAHKSDAKCLVSTSSGSIISSGRDEMVKIWAKRGGEYSETAVYTMPKGAVPNAIGYYENEMDGSWRVYVGRKDGQIDVYGPSSVKPIASLHQHKQNVCCLYVDSKNKMLLSGSWDNTIVVWPIDQLENKEFNALLLLGHLLSVWAVASFPNMPNYYLSGSADKTIKFWRDDEPLRTFKGHTDVVRSLVVLSSMQFISASNDSTIRLWKITLSSALRVFESKCDSFIYSVRMVGNFMVAATEGGFIEVWRQHVGQDDEDFSLSHSQLIQAPATSLWAVAPLSDSDFGIAASDGRVYIYSVDTSRKATADVLEMIDEELASRLQSELLRKEEEKNQDIVIDVSLDDSNAKLKLRYTKGTDPSVAAQTFIQENNLSSSYLNEITEFLIQNVPEARIAQNKKYSKQVTQKTEVDGVLYDYAFEVDVGGEHLILPCNANEDPSEAAQRFVEKYNLPIKYIGQFSKFITSQISPSGNISASNLITSGYADPFTGEGRYVPDVHNSKYTAGADPLTGEGRYVPPVKTGNSTSRSGVSGSGDPFTSSGRYIPGSGNTQLIPNASLPQDKIRPRGELVPLSEYYSFGTEINSEKALLKLKELNDQQIENKCSTEEMDVLVKLSTANSNTIMDGRLETSALDKCLKWSINKDFAAVMNVFRLAMLHEPLNNYYCSKAGRGEYTLNLLIALLASDEYEPIRVLTCRAVANAFVYDAGRHMLLFGESNLIQLVMKQMLFRSTHLQIAAASALANWSLLLLRRSEKVSELGPREDLLRMFIKDLEGVHSFGEYNKNALLRLLQTIVTAMWGDIQVITLGKNRNLLTVVDRMKDAVVDEMAKNIARDIVEMIYAV